MSHGNELDLDFRGLDGGEADHERHGRSSMRVTSELKGRALMLLVFLGVLPLPIVAYALGAYVVTGRMLAGGRAQVLGGQLLLLLTVLLVASAGGFVIWRMVASLTRAMDDEREMVNVTGALGERGEQSGPVVNSVSRMLTTIDRQATDLEQFAQRLERANREVEWAKDRLREVSRTDEVTGLPDRHVFSARLEEEMARCLRFGHPLSVVLLALDDFTSVKDELSHEGADETLRGVAQILLGGSRAVDIVCRHGADEFAVLLVETPRSGAQVYAERIGATLSAASFGHGWKVTASLGVASLNEGATTSGELARGAREALLAARGAGKNCVAVWAGPGVGCRSEPEVRAT
jgi:diguanylate cyclase (GGDEF)-like protein